MKTLLAVATCPRKGQSYLEKTVLALEREGAGHFDERVIFSDGPQDGVELPGWTTLFFPGPSGSRVAFWRIFQFAHVMHASKLLIVEDDVAPCRNAIARIAKIEVPASMALVTFHDMRYYPTPGAPHGIWKRGMRYDAANDFCGNQCLLFPARSIEYLVAQDPFGMPDERYWSRRNSADCVMGYLFDKSPWRHCGVHMPSLVEHVGLKSAAHPDEPFDRAKTCNFPGIEFDALSLELESFPIQA